MSTGPPNPFQAPNFADYPQPSFKISSAGLSSSIVIQLRVLAIMLIVHGVLCTLMGFIYLVLAVVMPTLLGGPDAGQKPPPPELKTFLLAVYAGAGGASLLAGLMQIFAGVQMLWLKGRVAGYLALVSCLLSCLTCYCLPTSLGLGIYGLIILLNKTSSLAYELAAEGKSYDEILQAAVLK
jgi:hypothetical protein